MATMIRMELRHRVEHHSGATTHAIDLTGVPAMVPGPRTLHWTARGQPDLAAPPVLDSFAIAVTLRLSRAGDELRVRGPMSRSGLFNVIRLLDLRRATSPGRYQPLRVVPNDIIEVVPLPTGDRGAVLAFSGGVDSAHAAVRHAAGSRAKDSLDLKALVMVLGFEAGLGRQDVFDRMLARARPLSVDLGMPLVAVETNSKRLAASLWSQTATPLAAAALAMFWQTARHGIFGGGLPYGANFLPLGHQPLFDQCCPTRLHAGTVRNSVRGPVAFS